jgi:TonB family protein
MLSCSRDLRTVVWLRTLYLASAGSAQESKSESAPPAEKQPSGQHRPKRVRVSQGVSQALLIKKDEPEYPQEARDKRIEGTVVLQVQISEAGDVTEVRLISGHPLLAPAAIEAVKQWKYKPYLLNGEPVQVETRVTVDFRVNPKPAERTASAIAWLRWGSVRS